MPDIDPLRSHLHLRIVYYGPSRAGKTATLRYLQRRLPPAAGPLLMSLDLKGDRTLPFECLRFAFDLKPDWHITAQLLSVPGRRPFNAARKLLLRGVDGIIVVADSCRRQRHPNLASLQNLQDNLSCYNLSLSDLPLVLQFHKRDLAGDDQLVMPLALLRDDLVAKIPAPAFPTSAVTGEGLVESLKHLAGLILTPRLHRMPAPRPAAL